MEKLYSIQEVSQILGISKDTLRYYDRIGIVSPSRENNKYRKYSKNDIIDLMHIQIMQHADFSLQEIKGKFRFHKMDNLDLDSCQEVAAFLDAKNAVIRKKIDHLEKISQLLHVASETLRNYNYESDHRLAEMVRKIYQDIRKKELRICEEEGNEHQG